MKRSIIIVVIVALVGWAVYDFLAESNSTNSADTPSISEEELENAEIGLERGNLAPDFELETIDGEAVKLSDFRGEKVLLNFWATWCPPCRAEMPDMQKYYEDHDDAVILAVNLVETEQKFDAIGEFIEEYGVSFNVLLDESTDVANIYDAHALPTSYLIDSYGMVHNKAIGAVNYDMLVQQFNEMN